MALLGRTPTVAPLEQEFILPEWSGASDTTRSSTRRGTRTGPSSSAAAGHPPAPHTVRLYPDMHPAAADPRPRAAPSAPQKNISGGEDRDQDVTGDTVSTTHEPDAPDTGSTPILAQDHDVSSASLGRTSSSSRTPGSSRATGPTEQDRALLHGLAVRMDESDARALWRAETTQHATAGIFDEMMKVLRKKRAEAADDRRNDQERWNARADLFDEDQRARWTNLHVELTPLIANVCL